MWPLVERELRVALRKRQPIMGRWLTALAGCALTGLFLVLAGRLAGGPPWGVPLFELLLLIAVSAILRAHRWSTGVLAEERRQQTLGLMVLAGLKPREILLGKLAGTAVVSFYDLLAILPLFALTFLGGGVSLSLLLATLACLPCLFLFTLSVSLLGSACCRDEGAARSAALGFAALVCLPAPLLYAAGLHLSGWPKVGPEWLRLCPASGLAMVAGVFRFGSWREFWLNSAVTIVWSLLALAATGMILERCWREAPGPGARAGYRERLTRWLHGSAAWRRRLAREWLDWNPFAWLAARDRLPVWLAWLAGPGLGGVLLALTWFGWSVSRQWPLVATFYFIALAMHASLESVINYAASRCLSQERRAGTLELLLTTPLAEEEIVQGQFAAVRRLVQPAVWTMAGLDAAMLLAGLGLHRWTPLTLAEYLVLWLGFWSLGVRRPFDRTVLAMWVGLNSGRPVLRLAANDPLRGASRLLVWVLIFPVGLRNLWRFPSGSGRELMFLACMMMMIVAWNLVGPGTPFRAMEIKLRRELRAIAQEPLPDPNDPRFRKWDRTKRFPWHDATPVPPLLKRLIWQVWVPLWRRILLGRKQSRGGGRGTAPSGGPRGSDPAAR